MYQLCEQSEFGFSSIPNPVNPHAVNAQKAARVAMAIVQDVAPFGPVVSVAATTLALGSLCAAAGVKIETVLPALNKAHETANKVVKEAQETIQDRLFDRLGIPAELRSMFNRKSVAQAETRATDEQPGPTTEDQPAATDEAPAIEA